MACSVIPGQRDWSAVVDDEGHREYKLKYRVVGNTTDGPAAAMVASGLPAFGVQWILDGENDPWAWRRHGMTVTPVTVEEPNRFFDVELKFGTKPPDNKSCQESNVTDPLLQPAKVSGSFNKYEEEITRDRFGALIHNSAFEQIRGPQMKFDAGRPHVKVEHNVATLDFALVASMYEHVNAYPLWGVGIRCIKLSAFSWEQKFYGNCYRYYSRSYEFDIRYDTFDRDVLDEGTKAIHGHWDAASGLYVLDKIGGVLPDNTNPDHFDRFLDRQGNPCRVILNGVGFPVGVKYGLPGTAGTAGSTFDTGGPGTVHVEHYGEADFSLLGIPLSF